MTTPPNSRACSLCGVIGWLRVAVTTRMEWLVGMEQASKQAHTRHVHGGILHADVPVLSQHHPHQLQYACVLLGRRPRGRTWGRGHTHVRVRHQAPSSQPIEELETGTPNTQQQIPTHVAVLGLVILDDPGQVPEDPVQRCYDEVEPAQPVQVLRQALPVTCVRWTACDGSGHNHRCAHVQACL